MNNVTEGLPLWLRHVNCDRLLPSAPISVPGYLSPERVHSDRFVNGQEGFAMLSVLLIMDPNSMLGGMCVPDLRGKLTKPLKQTDPSTGNTPALLALPQQLTCLLEDKAWALRRI